MKNKNMLTASAAIALLALYQVVTLILTAPALLNMDNSHLDQLMQITTSIISYVMLAGTGLSVVLLAVLAAKGFMEAREPSEAKFHIIFAQLMNIFYAISLVGGIIQLFNGVTLAAAAAELIVTAVYFAATLFYSIAARRNRIAG